MHPHITGSISEQRRRDLSATASRVQRAAGSGGQRRFARRAPVVIPRVRVTWTRTTLALADTPHSPRSWVLVISATRAR